MQNQQHYRIKRFLKLDDTQKLSGCGCLVPETELYNDLQETGDDELGGEDNNSDIANEIESPISRLFARPSVPTASAC
jgi:hypothetical protein